MAAGGGSGNNINIGANFSGTAAFSQFQGGMQNNVNIANSFNLAIGKLNIASNAFVQSTIGMNSAITNTFTSTASFDRSVLHLTNVLGGLGSALSAITVATGAFNQSTTGANSAITNSITINARATQANQGYFLSLQNIARIAQAQVVSRYTQAIGQALDDGVTAAANFDVKIAAIRTISQDTAASQEYWRQVVRGLSDEFGNPLLDAAAGTYEAISNQVAKGASAATFMAQAMQFARTTLSTTADAVNLLSSVLNAFEISAEETTRVSAVLFRTIELGRTTATEMANIFGPTAVSAHLLGISLEEVGASVAILTSQGTHTNTALTLTSNLINKLVKPTEAMKGLFKEWGVASGEAAIATYGLDGVIQKLTEVVQRGGLTELADTLKDLRAIRGAAGLTGGNILGDFSTVLTSIKEGTASYMKAQELIAQSAGAIFKKEVNKVQNILTMDLGNSMLEFLTKLSGGVGNASQMMKGTTDAIYALVESMVSLVGILPVAINTFGSFVSQFIPVPNLMSSIIIGAIGVASALRLVGVSAAVAATSMAMLEAATPWLRAIGLAIIGLTTAYALWIDWIRKQEQAELDALKATQDGYEDVHKERIKQIQERIDAERKAAEEIGKSAHQALAAITLGWEASIDSMTAKNGGLEAQMKTISGILEGIQKDFDNAELNDIGKQFAKGIAAGDTIQGIADITQSIEKLGLITHQELFDGNFELAGRAFDQFKDSIKEAQKEIEESIKDSLKREEDALKSFANRKFDLEIGGMSDSAAKTAMTDEVERLKKEAVDLATKGDAKGAQEALKRAEELARDLTSKAGKQSADEKLLGIKKPVDLTLEESVLKARQEVEKLGRDDDGKRSQELKQTEYDMTQLVTKELEAQLKLATNMNDAIKARIKLQEELSAGQKALEAMNKQELDFRTKQKEIAASFLQASAQTSELKESTFGLRGVDRIAQDSLNADHERLAAAQKKAADEIMAGEKSVLQVQNEYAQAVEAYRNSAGAKSASNSKRKGQTQQFREAVTAGDAATAGLAVLRDDKGKLDANLAQRPKLEQSVSDAKAALTKYATLNFNGIFVEIGNEAAKPIETMAEKLKRLLAELKASGNAAFPNMPEKFNQGGMVAGSSGFDNLWVKAMAGESFINKEMTARYYPSIKAMNQGTQRVSNNNTYNFAFKVDGGGTSEATVRDIGAQLGRAIRRGQVPGLG